MRFGDVVTCVASLAVIMVLVSVPIELVLVPALAPPWGTLVTQAVSFFLTALIGGYIFARKIWEEAGIQAIAKITVFCAVLWVFYLANWAGT